MFPGNIHPFAIVASALASVAIGFGWFMFAFREPYMKALGKTVEEMNRGPSGLVATIYLFIGALVTAYVLGWFMVATNRQSVEDGLFVAFLVWLGFVVAINGPMYAYQAYSLTFFGIMVGYSLLALLATGAILGAWKT